MILFAYEAFWKEMKRQHPSLSFQNTPILAISHGREVISSMAKSNCCSSQNERISSIGTRSALQTTSSFTPCRFTHKPMLTSPTCLHQTKCRMRAVYLSLTDARCGHFVHRSMPCHWGTLLDRREPKRFLKNHWHNSPLIECIETMKICNSEQWYWWNALRQWRYATVNNDIGGRHESMKINTSDYLFLCCACSCFLAVLSSLWNDSAILYHLWTNKKSNLIKFLLDFLF